jgi:hypothetical protein
VPSLFHLSSCTPTKCNLYFNSSFETVISEAALYSLLIFHVPNLKSMFLSLGQLSKESAQAQDPFKHFITSSLSLSPSVSLFNGLWLLAQCSDCLCGLVVRVPGSIFGGPGFDSRALQEEKVVGLERGPLSLVNTTEELLGRNSSGSCLENREYGRRDSLRWPCGTLYPQKSWQ